MNNKKEIVIVIISALFVLLFLYTGAIKLYDTGKFAVELAKSPLLTPIAGLAAWSVPAAEIVIAVFLIFSRTRLAALYATLYMMTAFTTYVIVLTQFSFYVPCSCGGFISGLSHMQHLSLTIGGMALAFAAIMLHHEQEPEPEGNHTAALA